MFSFQHQSVLLDQAVTALVNREDGTYIDGTFGRGGHSQLILNRLQQAGRLIAIDKDPAAIEVGKSWQDKRFTIDKASFAAMTEISSGYGVKKVSGILLDLGVSSPQLDDATRGFSFQADGPLDMRMDPTQGQSLADWLATASQTDITEVIKYYGEERSAKQIAAALIARRNQEQELGKLNRTSELASIIARIVKHHPHHRHPATKTFQAFRIFINQELDDLSIGLKAALALLEKGGRLVVLSFHSLEDRIVKQFINSHSILPTANRHLPFMMEQPPRLQLRRIARVRVDDNEKSTNARSRSVIMRVAEKLI